MSQTGLGERRRLAALAYENAGREITQTFEVMNANLALAAGALAALLAVLGAGELFATDPEALRQDAFPRVSSVSLVVLAATVPLILRFFVRSLTAYQNLLRFLEIQRAAWVYLSGAKSWSFFLLHHEIYWVRWRTPRTMHRLAWENLKYGFMWVVVVAAGALGWAFWSVEPRPPRVVAGGILLAGLLWEGVTLAATRNRYWRTPDDSERQRLQDAKCEEPEGMPSSPTVETAQDSPPPIIESAEGVFLGRLGLRRLRGGK